MHACPGWALVVWTVALCISRASTAENIWPEATFPPRWSTSTASPGANAGACTWLHYMAIADASGNVSHAQKIVVEALSSLNKDALKQAGIPVAMLSEIEAMKANVSDPACMQNPPESTNFTLPWHPWMRSTEGNVGDLAHHKVLLETATARVLSVHSDVGDAGRFHTHGAFSVALTYGFPMVIRQWDLGDLISNIPESNCFLDSEMRVSFLPPTWIHRVMPKGCMSHDKAPNCPMDVAPRCGPGSGGHTGFFFRIEIRETTPLFVDVVNPPAPTLPPSLPYSVDMTSWIRRGSGDLLTQRVKYRYEHHQGLWTTLGADDPRSKTCNVLFDSDGSVWEWYEDVQRCAKTFSGVPVMSPDFYAGWKNARAHASIHNPFTQHDAFVSAVCADNLTCFAWNESSGLPVFHTHGAPLSNVSAAGVTWYGDFDVQPQVLSRFTLPRFCPHHDDPPKYNATEVDLAKVCKRGWMQGHRQSSQQESFLLFA